MNPKSCLNPLTGKPFQWDEYYAFHDTVMAFGLTQDREESLQTIFSGLKMKLYCSGIVSDLYGIPACYVIIDPSSLKTEEINELIEFWADDHDLRIIFLDALPTNTNLKKIKGKFDVRSLSDLEGLRLDILHHKTSLDKSRDKATKYGNRVLRILTILKYLKTHRLATSQVLAEEMEVSVRTIQRDILIIEQLGEPLAYDHKTKSYFLLTGESFLWKD